PRRIEEMALQATDVEIHHPSSFGLGYVVEVPAVIHRVTEGKDEIDVGLGERSQEERRVFLGLLQPGAMHMLELRRLFIHLLEQPGESAAERTIQAGDQVDQTFHGNRRHLRLVGLHARESRVTCHQVEEKRRSAARWGRDKDRLAYLRSAVASVEDIV